MYGILIVCGIFIASLLAESAAKKQHLPTDILWDGFIILLLSGFLGARIFHVFEFWEVYRIVPITAFYVWHGGLNIIGGIILAVPSIYFYLLYKKASVLKWLDIIAFVMPLAQAIGRLGNIYNRELLPYAFYEIPLNLLLFCLLFFISRKRIYEGFSFSLYLVGYSIIRFVLEGLRPFHSEILGINTTKGLALLTILAIILFNALYYFRSRRI